MLRTWLVVVLIVTLGGLAFACSSGDDDVGPTSTPGGSPGGPSDTPTNGIETDGSTPPSDTRDPPDGTDGDPDAPGGPQDPASTSPDLTLGGAMRLTILDGGSCDAGECFVDAGATFTLAIEVLEAPADYVLLQTFIDYGGVYNPAAGEDEAGPGSCSDGIENGARDGLDRGDSDCVGLELTYLPSANVADEIFWTDLAPATAVRADLGPGLVGHGGITGLTPPLPESDETGVMVRLQMSCPAAATTIPISLLLYDDPLASTSGSAFVRQGGGAKIIPTVAPITVNCG